MNAFVGSSHSRASFAAASRIGTIRNRIGVITVTATEAASHANIPHQRSDEPHIADTHTVEIEGLTAVRIEMARFVGELLGDHADLIWIDQDWQVDVTDESGLILHVILGLAVTALLGWKVLGKATNSIARPVESR